MFEWRLVQIWEELLEVRPVGVRDNFFAVGGHSLLAVRLMARVERVFGKKLSLATLFQDATVENLANVLRQETGQAEVWSQLVALQEHGQRQPFFCVHPAGGNVICYAPLARHMGNEQPFYGLQARGLDGAEAPRVSVESMAAEYVEAVRAVQPEGPYALGGWSVGGVIAFEAARRLEARGQRVSLLALIDSMPPRPAAEDGLEDDETSLMLRFARDLGIEADESAPALEEFRALDGERQLAFALEQARKAGVVNSDVTAARLRALFEVYKANVAAVRGYVPRAYAGRVHLFSAERQSPESSRRQVEGWGRLAAGGLEVRALPGNHYGIMKEPLVSGLAAELRACLDAACAGLGAEQLTHTS